MPYKSEAQRKFFHTETARKKGITPQMVSEYDDASRGETLPKKVKKPSESKRFISALKGKKR